MGDKDLVRTLPVVDKKVFRLGLAGNYGIDESGIEWALSETEINDVFWTPRMGRVTGPVLRALARDRDRYVVANARSQSRCCEDRAHGQGRALLDEGLRQNRARLSNTGSKIRFTDANRDVSEEQAGCLLHNMPVARTGCSALPQPATPDRDAGQGPFRRGGFYTRPSVLLRVRPNQGTFGRTSVGPASACPGRERQSVLDGRRPGIRGRIEFVAEDGFQGTRSPYQGGDLRAERGSARVSGGDQHRMRL